MTQLTIAELLKIANLKQIELMIHNFSFLENLIEFHWIKKLKDKTFRQRKSISC